MRCIQICLDICFLMQIAPEESWLSFDEKAVVLHNKVSLQFHFVMRYVCYIVTFQVRAFAGWPGTRAKVSVLDPKSCQENIIELKIITTRVYGDTDIQSGEVDDVFFKRGSLIFPCGGGTALEVIF